MAYPTVVQTSKAATTATNTTSHPITLPSGITTGNLLVAIFSTDGSPQLSASAGWSRIDIESQGAIVKSAVYFKYATGSDALTITTDTVEQSSHIVYELNNAAPPIAESISGNSTNADPPVCSGVGSADYLVIATCAHDSTIVASAAPSGYGSLTTQAAAGTGGASVSTAHKTVTASSEDPGAFTSTSEQWVAFTLLFGEYGTYDVTIANDPTGSNDNSYGTLAWSNPTNVSARDEVYVTRTLSGLASTNYLKALDYGMAIPSGALILGIKVGVKKYRTGGSAGAARDDVVRLVKGGTVVGNNYADTGTNWATTDDTYAYGGAGDLWGTTWTDTELNAADFGVVFSAKGSTSGTDRVVNVDNIRVVVYYESTPNSLSTIALNTADAHNFGTNQTPTIEFTGSDADGDDLTYEVMADLNNTFDSQSSGIATIAYDNFTKNYQASGVTSSSKNQNHTVNTADNTNLYAILWLPSSALNPTCALDGVSMTQIGSKITVGSGAYCIWYATGVSAGTRSVQFSFGANSYYSLSIITFTGCMAAAPEVIDTESGTATTATTNTITPLTTGDMLLGLVGVATAQNSISATDGQTLNQMEGNSGASPMVMGVGYRGPISGTSAQNDRYSWSMSSDYEQVSLAIKGASSTGPLLYVASNTDAGFANTVTGGDTDPFNAGEKIGYTFQSTLAFDIYYWKARVKDPAGRNAWSDWSSTYSFEVGGGVVTTTKTITGKARIAKNVDVTITGKAKVVTTELKTITGKARIGLITTKTLTGLSRILKTVTQTVTGKGRITATTTRTQTGKGRISRTGTQTITGVSRLLVNVTVNKTQTGIARILASATQQLTGKGRITATTTKTLTGKGRIGYVTPQTITGVSRIAKNILSTITGKARVQKSVTQTITGKGRVGYTTTQTITGKSRIGYITSQTLTGIARIQKTILSDIIGRARLQRTESSDITGRARIGYITPQTLTGKSRIATAVNQQLTGIAKITATTAKTITGVAQVLQGGQITITGIARITQSVPTIIQGLARVNASATQSQTGKARITNSASQNVTGRSRIALITQKVQTGVSRIMASSTPSQTGKARISIYSSQTIDGQARLIHTNTQSITGKARVSKIVQAVISGKASVAQGFDQIITGIANIVKRQWGDVPKIDTSKQDRPSLSTTEKKPKVGIMVREIPDSPPGIIYDAELEYDNDMPYAIPTRTPDKPKVKSSNEDKPDVIS